MDQNTEKFDTELLHWIQQYPAKDRQDRPSWDEWFILFAFMASRRSPCLRRQVGAVIVKNKDVIAVGYNASPAYQPNCIELNNCYRNVHDIKSGTQLELCRSSGSHAESNAIAYASRNGHSTQDAVMYVFGHAFICNICRGIIANAGIKEVYHLKEDGTIEHVMVSDWKVNPIDQ